MASRDARGHRARVAVIFCSVLVRGIILSGYPLYPTTALRVNVDWRVPISSGQRRARVHLNVLEPNYVPPTIGRSQVGPGYQRGRDPRR